MYYKRSIHKLLAKKTYRGRQTNKSNFGAQESNWICSPWQRASRTERIASSLISELLEIKTFYLQGAYEDYVRARSQKSYELDNNHSDAGN